MKSKLIKRVFVIFMTITLTISSVIVSYEKAYADAATVEELIGAAGGAVALSGCTVAGICLLGLGIIVAAEYKDEIFESMHQKTEKDAEFVTDGAQTVAYWWEQAKQGIIDTSSSVWNSCIDFCIDSFYSSQGESIAFDGWQIVKKGENVDVGSGRTITITSCDSNGILLAGATDSRQCEFLFISNNNSYGSFSFDCSRGDQSTRSQIFDNRNNVHFTYYTLSLSWSPYFSKFISPKMSVLDFINSTGSYDDLVGAKDDVNQYDYTQVGNIGQTITGGSSVSVAGDKDNVIDYTGGIAGERVTDDLIQEILERVAAGELTWSEAMELIQAITYDTTTDNVITEEGVTDKTREEEQEKNKEESKGQETTEDQKKYTADLRYFFPFCIPFDIYDMMNALVADPVAPNFKWQISVLGQTYDIDIDLSAFDTVAQILRDMEIVLFCVGLAFATNSLIKH